MGLRTNAKEMHYLSPVHQTLQGSPGVAGEESLAPAGEMMLPSSLLARERGGWWLTATGRGQHWHTTPGIQEGEAVHCYFWAESHNHLRRRDFETHTHAIQPTLETSWKYL